ncbi:hypothetical protein EVAR_16125_1 [Eumeta japonica]|uniref:Uncharacterized protein n=1 Tax=Eumeta variegata TaxID=151549 RepID=A0A4C1UIG5_EUMVA|nr:hypothetical protein EVAR_16125_1 [Eumeta japonica]
MEYLEEIYRLQKRKKKTANTKQNFPAFCRNKLLGIQVHASTINRGHLLRRNRFMRRACDKYTKLRRRGRDTTQVCRVNSIGKLPTPYMIHRPLYCGAAINSNVGRTARRGLPSVHFWAAPLMAEHVPKQRTVGRKLETSGSLFRAQLDFGKNKETESRRRPTGTKWNQSVRPECCELISSLREPFCSQ